MNKSLLLENVDPSELSECIAIALVVKLKPLIEASREPMLVPPDEMARLAGISRPFLDRLRAAGKIPSIQIGRSRRYEPSRVIAALAAGEANHE